MKKESKKKLTKSEKRRGFNSLVDAAALIMACIYFFTRGNWDYQWVIDALWIVVLLLMVRRRFRKKDE
ncbi:hypothetical protein SDC9_20909 [bioreactor metagenome]|uniref:Uncharacterized protein n=1 Tax=bioreactor metagenome TaxID=1076179 RepID=A0A644U820_9ZZZZ|nr:hypothetical protein [Negativicutes bacterium]